VLGAMVFLWFFSSLSGSDQSRYYGGVS